jgi:hypothetical protein
VRAGDYRFRLEPGQKRVFRAQVAPRVADPGELCLALRFHTRPGADSFDDVGLVYINSQSVCG